MKFLHYTLIAAIALFGLAAEPTFAKTKTPKALKKIEKSVDKSDPVQVAVFTILQDYENGFANLIGEPVSAEQREQLVQDTLASSVYGQQKSQMDRLRDAEIYADSAREVNVSIPGATAFYYKQEVVQPGATSLMHGVQIVFDVPFEERVAFARDLGNRLAGMFRKDGKWMKSGTEDPSLNPVYGQIIYVYMLSMTGSEMLMASSEYGQTREVHDLTHGVRMMVYKMDMKR